MVNDILRGGRSGLELHQSSQTRGQDLIWVGICVGLIQSEHRRDHTAGFRSTFEEVGLEDVLAVVPGLAVLALEGSKRM